MQSSASRVKQAEVFESIFFNFWKNLCECRLLPLTTDFHPEDKEISNIKEYYCNEQGLIERPVGNRVTLFTSDQDFLEEFLCLRLTQNMQYFTKEGTCHYDKNQFMQKQLQFKLGIGEMHHRLKFYDDDRYQYEAYVHLNHSISDEMSAKFKYLLFNYHENKFQIKQSQEDRLFNFKSISNLDEVLEEFSQINEACVKVP